MGQAAGGVEVGGLRRAAHPTAGWQLYIMGFICYSDDNKVARRTTFCRLYNIREQRFKRLAEDDPDYDYEE